MNKRDAKYKALFESASAINRWMDNVFDLSPPDHRKVVAEMQTIRDRLLDRATGLRRQSAQQDAAAVPEKCGTCDGSGHVPCPDGYAICRECSGRRA